MKISSNSIYFCLTIFLLGFPLVSFSQQTTLVAELTGNPPDLTEWTATDIDIEGEEIVLTQVETGATGAVFFSQPYDLNQCSKWKVEYDFRLFDGNGADGLAFYYLENPPTSFDQGEFIGLPAQSRGLKVIFDTFDNDQDSGGNPNPELQVYYGEGYNEILPSPDMLKAQIPDIRSDDYQHAEIEWNNGFIIVKINGTTVLGASPTPFDNVEDIAAGYFGFSASTGGSYDRQSIKNVKVFVNAIELDNDEVSIAACDQDGDGFAQYDLTSVADLLSSVGDFSYYTNLNDAGTSTDPIPDSDLDSYTNDTAYANETIYVRIENNEGCYALGKINLILTTPPDVNKNLIDIQGSCDLDQDGIEKYDLTQVESQFIDNPDDFDFSYFESQSGAQSGDTNVAISNFTDFPVQAGATKTVYVRIENEGCFTIVAITLRTFVTPEIKSVEQLNECDNSSGNYVFDLTINTDNILGNQNPTDIKIEYYTSQAEADNGQNPITDKTAFEVASGCETIYVRVENDNHSECYTTTNFEVCGIDLSIGALQDLSQCSSGNGLPFYDLTENNSDVIGNLDSALYKLSYYRTMDDAENGQNPITDASNYQAEDSQQTIFVRLENIQNPNCFAVESFVLKAIDVNIVELEAFAICKSESSTYDLTEVEKGLNISDDQMIAGYYMSLSDLNANQNAIETPSEFNYSGDIQHIYIKVEGSQQGCFEIYSLPLIIKPCEFEIPKGFSPNEDGINDKFEISNLYEPHPNFKLKIFSRYGRIVYEGNNKKEPWDGNSKNGNEVPSGTYYYVLDLGDSESDIIKGWVYLNR